MPQATSKVEELFSAALELESPEARSAFLDRACGDTELRRRVEELLAAAPDADGFLEAPASMPTVTAAHDSLSGVVEAGTAIGPYKLLEPIGEGGMGTVYMAEQAEPLRRRVALKIIKPGMDSKQVVARFDAERQALAMMDHPNIARVLDGGMTPTGHPYFVMELVRGLPVTEYCDRHQLTIAERLELFVLVCRAVQHAHQKGVIHRDLKPSNVLVTDIDGVATPKVIDFGVAKATGGALTEKTLFTGFHQFVGTPLYVSPEQAELSGADVDTRSDIYSLGVLLYELLTGTTPFDSETLRRAAFDEMRRIIREEEPPKPSTRLSSLGATRTTVSANRGSDARRLGRSVRGELDWLVMKALEKDRRRRYETANDFAADVMRYLSDQPVEACPPSARYRFVKFARRNRLALTTAALVAGALLLGLTASVLMAVRAIDAEGRTTAALAQARANLAEAGRQRTYARKAVDEMYTQVAEKWLTREGRLTPLQRDFLEKALAFNERFAGEQANDPEARFEAAKAATRVGEIRLELGLSAAALEAHRRALDAFRRLAAEFPDRSEYLRRVAHSQHLLGRLHHSLGRTGEAEPAFREAVTLREQLAEASGSPGDRADLAVSLDCLGGLLRSTGRAADGERTALRGIGLLTRLTDEFPKEPDYQSLLASAEVRLGALYLNDDQRRGEAEAPFRRALELRQRLADADPADPKYQRDLALSHFSIGEYFRHTSSRQAAAALRRGLPIQAKLVADHPDRPRYRAILAAMHSALAEVLVSLGQIDEAEQTSRRSLEVAEKLAAEFPDVPDNRSLVVSGLMQLGKLQAQRGRNGEAREAFERAYDIQRKLCADHPGLSSFRHNLAANSYGAAVEYATLTGLSPGDVARALELAREAVEIEPKEPGFWKGLALAEYRAGNLDAALKAETKTLEIRKSAGYSYDWLLLALIHLGRGNREQARPWALGVIRSRPPGGWKGGEPSFVRLARESEERLRALLPNDPEGLRALLERELEAQSRRQGPAAPFTLSLRDWLADQLATLGRYDEATALLQESQRLEPDRVEPWLPLGVLTLRKGDLDGCRALCSEILRRFDLAGTKAKAPRVAARISRLCTATPGLVDDQNRQLALGRRAASADDHEPYFLLACGAAEFRAGQHQAAVETLAGSVSRFGDAPGRAQANLFLALAHHRLGHAEAARRALAEAERALAEVPDEPDPSTLVRAWHWDELILAQCLRREAVEALGIASPPEGRSGGASSGAGPHRPTEPGKGSPGTPKHGERGQPPDEESGP